MTENEITRIAENADMVVSGYAFSLEDNLVRVLNLNNPQKAVVLSKEGKMLETSMDDIEVQVVINYFERNKKFLED